MRSFRIADGRFPIFDGTGARLAGARWNSPGQPVIYSAETFAGAMLEILAHSNLYRLPRNQFFVEIRVPETLSSELVPDVVFADLESGVESSTQQFGDRWLRERRSLVLIAPSVVTNGIEKNLLINPLHPEFVEIKTSLPQPVQWDSRLFAVRQK